MNIKTCKYKNTNGLEPKALNNQVNYDEYNLYSRPVAAYSRNKFTIYENLISEMLRDMKRWKPSYSMVH